MNIIESELQFTLKVFLMLIELIGAITVIVVGLQFVRIVFCTLDEFAERVVQFLTDKLRRLHK